MNKVAYMKMMYPQEMLKKATEERDKEAEKTRKKEQDKAKNQASKSSRRRTGKWHSENIGGATSVITSGLLGALIGGGLGSMRKAPVLTGDPALGAPEGEKVPLHLIGQSGELEPVYKGTKALHGALAGGAVGVIAALLANKLGRGLAGFAGPRTLKKQVDYNDSVGQTVGNYLVPGMSGWNKARTAMSKDEQDAVFQELLLKQKLKASGLA